MIAWLSGFSQRVRMAALRGTFWLGVVSLFSGLVGLLYALVMGYEQWSIDLILNGTHARHSGAFKWVLPAMVASQAITAGCLLIGRCLEAASLDWDEPE